MVDKPGIKKKQKRILKVIGQFLDKISRESPEIFNLPSELIYKCKHETSLKTGEIFKEERGFKSFYFVS